MSALVDLSTAKQGSVPSTGGKRQGLRKLSPDLISKAIDETNAQIIRIGLTFLGTAAFCLLSLLSPDSALLGGSEKINVPLAGPVSFFGFMVLGPAVLIMLRVYLQLYVEHSNRLERFGRSMLAMRAPTLMPLKNPLIRVLGGLTFYLVMPTAMILFAWKAAVFPRWGMGLLSVAVGVIASHAMLPLGMVSWRSKAVLSVIVAIIAGGVTFFVPLRRPFDLRYANLSSAILSHANLTDVDLSFTNLSAAYLGLADLSRANLSGANLSGARLSVANLSYANLSGANLSGARLSVANLSYANLTQANLSGAHMWGATLTHAKLGLADLTSALLSAVMLNEANLTRADLTRANLLGADLTDAKLIEANLIGANLSYAKLTGADLSDADLSGAALTQVKGLDEACGSVRTKLPEGFSVKPCQSSDKK